MAIWKQLNSGGLKSCIQIFNCTRVDPLNSQCCSIVKCMAVVPRKETPVSIASFPFNCLHDCFFKKTLSKQVLKYCNKFLHYKILMMRYMASYMRDVVCNICQTVLPLFRAKRYFFLNLKNSLYKYNKFVLNNILKPREDLYFPKLKLDRYHLYKGGIYCNQFYL